MNRVVRGDLMKGGSILASLLKGSNELLKYSEEMTGIQEIGDVMNVCLLGNDVCLIGNAVCLQVTSSLLGPIRHVIGLPSRYNILCTLVNSISFLVAYCLCSGSYY
jgi:hypothetical protein